MTAASGYGLLTLADDAVLDAWFPSPVLGATDGDAPAELTALEGDDDVRGVRREVRLVEIADLDDGTGLDRGRLAAAAPALHAARAAARAVARRHLRPAGQRRVDLRRPLRGRGLRGHPRAAAREPGQHVTVFGVDKFPRLVDYVLPTGVRIADADRVRLGAHLAEGTTVMHEGFVNFNAGTLGESMVEGRISAGVVVGDGSDIGGGASVMGTLSGGGKEVISVGERCLVGANAGIGISLGDDCVVEAGCYVTAGTKVTVTDIDGKPQVVKAATLSGVDNILFRRNSVSGAIEAVPWKGGSDGAGIALNAALHAN